MKAFTSASRVLSSSGIAVTRGAGSLTPPGAAIGPRVGQAPYSLFKGGVNGPKAGPSPLSPRKALTVFNSGEKGLINVAGFQQVPGEEAWGTGVPHEALRPIKDSEKTPLESGIRSTKTGPLQMEVGVRYFFLIDPERGITYAKDVSHPLIRNPVDGMASVGGEMELRQGGAELVFNTKSGRYTTKLSPTEQEARCAAIQLALEKLQKDEFGGPVVIRFDYDL